MIMENISDYNIPSKLKELRATLELTQGEFADRVGMKQSAYSMIENGNNKIGVEVLKRIINTYNIDSNYFFRNTPLNVNLNVNNDVNQNNINSDNIIIYDKNDFVKHYDDLVNTIQTIYGLILLHGDNKYVTLEMLERLKTFQGNGFKSIIDALLKKDPKKNLETVTREIIKVFPDVVEELRHSVNVLGVTIQGIEYKQGASVHFQLEDLEHQIKDRDGLHDDH